jgi:PAS domain S-box-containing protein
MTDKKRTRTQSQEVTDSLEERLSNVGGSADRTEAPGNILPNEKTLRNILGAVPVGIGYYERGELTWANETMLEMFGFESLEEAIGIQPIDMYSSEQEYLRVREIFFESLARREQAQADARFKVKDGTGFHGHIVISSPDANNPLEGTIACISNIDWRIAAKEALKKKEKLLQHILAASPVGLCLVEDGKFSWVNEALLRMFGRTHEDELVGETTRLLYGSEDEFEKATKTLYTGLETTETEEIFVKLARRDGSVFDAQLRASAIDRANPMKGAVTAITDVSWIVEAEDLLMESERRFREILENVHLVAVGMDIDGRITFANDFLLEMSGWERQEVLGQSWFDVFVPAEHRKKQKARFSRLKEGGIAIHGKTAILTKNNERRIISWSNTILRAPSKKITGLASIGEDITDRRRADTLLLQTERIKAIGEMAGAIAHNFNNLLQIVTGGAQMALVHLELGNIHQIKPSLEQIVKSSSLGAQTVQRLQEFARIRADETVVDGMVFDLSQTVRQASEMSEPWWKTNPEMEGLRVELDLDLVPGCLIRGKENEMFEVTVNLIKNAVEAMPNGGRIEVRTSLNERHVTLHVRDSGIGIPQDSLGKVFEPFLDYQGAAGHRNGTVKLLRYRASTSGGHISLEQGRGRNMLHCEDSFGHQGSEDRRSIRDRARR